MRKGRRAQGQAYTRMMAHPYQLKPALHCPKSPLFPRVQLEVQLGLGRRRNRVRGARRETLVYLEVPPAETLGWIIDRSPKCTPEIAGDGIEFNWACAKMYYRKQPRIRKKTKRDFESLVRESLGEEVVTLTRTRKFSKRSRQNMVAYYNLLRDDKATTPSALKKFKEEKKCHRSTLDSCYGFIQQELRRIT